MITLQEEFNKTVADNLILYRKNSGLTQLALAEKLNYSDKAVSKWERGENLPDVYVLKQIADLYGVTVNDLITPSKKVKQPVKKMNALFIPLLSTCIVWIVATLAFFTLNSAYPNNDFQWLSFIIATPITCIVLLVFACVYKSLPLQLIFVSGLIWTLILSLHLCLINVFPQILYFYFVGIPLQALAIIWYAYRLTLKRKKK